MTVAYLLLIERFQQQLSEKTVDSAIRVSNDEKWQKKTHQNNWKY